jgi:predicted CXXCH cytochrome family protein
MINWPCIRTIDATAMMDRKQITAIAGFLICAGLCIAAPAFAVEHPGLVEQECSSCHVRMIAGKSVHSAMSSPCTVCHVAMTKGDMTTVTLSMPKERICFACHEESASLRQHVPAVKGECVECHDAHSSQRRLLLREEARLPAGKTATVRLPVKEVNIPTLSRQTAAR